MAEKRDCTVCGGLGSIADPDDTTDRYTIDCPYCDEHGKELVSTFKSQLLSALAAHDAAIEAEEDALIDEDCRRYHEGRDE